MANVLKHGTGAINVGGCRVEMDEVLTMARPPSSARTDKAAPQTNRGAAVYHYQNDVGRWPANVVHDGSLDVFEALPFANRGAFRFFYSAKADRTEREFGMDGAASRPREPGRRAGSAGTGNAYNNGAEPRSNFHPTVKPIDLMRWLVRLITPPGGVVLEPFMGSGSTGIAAVREGCGFIGIERDPEYFEIARRRIQAALDERDRAPDLLASLRAPAAQQMAFALH